MTAITAEDVAGACRRALAAAAAAEDELNAADAALGDGDTGQTMRRVAEKVAAAADPLLPLGRLFRKLGMAATEATGSSLGTLVAIGLMAMGKSLGDTGSTDTAGIASALEAAEAAMLARGGASLGDKTALDMLHAVRTALAASDGTDADEAVRKAAAQTLAAFRDRRCRIGRARIFAERSVGRDDPGMLAFARLVEACTSAG